MVMLGLGQFVHHFAVAYVRSQDESAGRQELKRAVDGRFRQPGQFSASLLVDLGRGQVSARVPQHVLVVLDEAYIEYVEAGDNLPDGVQFLSRFPNLLVSRTFSKAYGLASLRVGYALSSPQVADVLNRVRAPFNVNSLALAAACAALDDADYLAASRRTNDAGMAQLEAGFRRLGLSWIPSKGNFIAVDFGRDAAPINQELLRAGVIVRPVAGYGMSTFLRVSIGTEQENARFLEALEQILRG